MSDNMQPTIVVHYVRPVCITELTTAAIIHEASF